MRSKLILNDSLKLFELSFLKTQLTNHNIFYKFLNRTDFRDLQASYKNEFIDLPSKSIDSFHIPGNL